MVYLVGAGMGESDLITLRGISCIKKAEAIIYDRLADVSLLSYAPDDCLLIYAGKQSGNHTMPQEEINSLLVKYGRDKTVVRLKGGDSFVFGRGGEEVNALKENGIAYELVPGVSSSYGAAEYAGIPVTHRGVATSFHVITGHEMADGETVDYCALAKLNGTLVFLMGLKNAKTISENLIRNGKDGDTKAAIISNAGTVKQQCIAGTLKTLPDIAGRAQPPAVIVIGDVVELQTEWYKPLRKKILTTGTKQINENIKKAFGDVAVTAIPLIKITEINYDKFLETDLTAFSHIAFTSANGVSAFFKYLIKSGQDIRSLANIKFAVVGNKTAGKLKEYGINADIVPKISNSSELAKELENCGAKDVLLICAENGNANIDCDKLPIYKTEPDFGKKELLNVTASDMDYIIFSSGSAAQAYSEMTDGKTNAKFISIGAATTKAAKECGIEIYKTAKISDAECIAETILGDIEK